MSSNAAFFQNKYHFEVNPFWLFIYPELGEEIPAQIIGSSLH